MYMSLSLIGQQLFFSPPVREVGGEGKYTRLLRGHIDEKHLKVLHACVWPGDFSNFLNFLPFEFILERTIIKFDSDAGLFLNVYQRENWVCCCCH